ncbi:hypothetical protein ACIFOE_17810 [Paenibacillus sp. NRS-1783]
MRTTGEAFTLGRMPSRATATGRGLGDMQAAKPRSSREAAYNLPLPAFNA